MHLNYGHMMSPMQFIQVFSSASGAKQRIIPETAENQIYIVAYRWKESILSFPMMCLSFKQICCKLVSNFNGRATCIIVQSAIGINTISQTGIDRSMLPGMG